MDDRVSLALNLDHLALIRTQMQVVSNPNPVVINPFNPVELDWYADDDVVRVTPRNQQRFEIQKDRAIEILQRAKEGERFQQQFALLLNRLAEWLVGQDSKILHAIVTLQDGTLAFVAVRHEARYDEQFEDELNELDFSIANDPDLDLIELKTLALPNVSECALRSFLDERLIFSYRHGQRSGPHKLS